MNKTSGAKRWGVGLKAARPSPSSSLAGVASSAMKSRSRSKQRPASRARRTATGARAAGGRAMSRARSVSRRARSVSGRAVTNLRDTTRAIQSTSNPVGRTLQRGQELARSPMHAHQRHKAAVRHRNLGFSSYAELFQAPSRQHVSSAHAFRAQPAHVPWQQHPYPHAMHAPSPHMPYAQPPRQRPQQMHPHHPQAGMLMMPPPQIPPQVAMCAQLLRQAGFLLQ